jgi:hypothetical protein
VEDQIDAPRRLQRERRGGLASGHLYLPISGGV